MDEPLFVLIHGMGESPHLWRGVRQKLPAGSRTHIPALRGDVTIEREAEHIVRSLENSSEAPLVVVGHSLGGLVATAMAEQLDDGPGVRRLLLINTPPALGSRLAGNSAKERALRIPLLGRLIWSMAGEATLRRSISSAFAAGADIPEQAVIDLKLTGHGRLLAMSRAIEAYLGAKPLAPRLQQLNSTTEVLFGMQDKRVDPRSLSVYDRCHNVTVRRLKDVGHSPPWEDPGAVARTILVSSTTG
jgi:pimeloyl-ACP methyl ester carboxylesterase